MHEIIMVDYATKDKEKLFIDLYKKAFPSVATYISRRGGSLEEAKDIFQDALIIFYEKNQEESFFIENEKAYLLGISKHLWSKKFKSTAQFQPLDTIKTNLMSSEDNGAPSSQKLIMFLERAGKKCMDILEAFYYDKLSAENIASKFGYSGTRSATVQKFKCLGKVRDQIKEKSLGYEDFLE